MDLESVESKPSVQEPIGIFQLIDQLETAVDKLMERQVYIACTVQVGVIKTDVALQYCSKCRTLLTNLRIMEKNNVYIGILFLLLYFCFYCTIV
jgi:predicted ATP-dependent Lon-type protease